MMKTNLLNIKKPQALSIILLFYVISISLAIGLTRTINFENDIYRVLFTDVVATCMIFFFSYTTKNSSVYDPYWSVIPPVILVYLMMENPNGNGIRQTIILLLVLFWAIRLTSNWARGWTGFGHEDWRYQKLANDTGKWYWLVSFLGIHMFPTLIVFLGCLPLWYIVPAEGAFQLKELIAVLVCFGGTLIELISDEQLKKFKKHHFSKNNMDQGLWAYSRHPNYLGEILFWIGLFLFIPFGNYPIEANYTAAGMISMIILFSFISIPMMEKRNLIYKEGYADYMKKVSALLPLKLNRINKK